jgi:hypothetical protein
MNLGWSSRQRWWVLAGAWIALVVLGIWGFLRQADALGLEVPFLDQLYFTLQLAALSYAGPDDAVNWQLQIARFAAPMLAAGTLLQSATVVFREQFARWRAHRARDHIIVCGLDGVGTRLVEALVEDSRRVVAVESSPSSPGVATVTSLGVPVVLGDPTDAAVLLAARVDRARRLVAATPSDGVNVAITAAVRSLGPASGRPALRCSVRLTDGDLAHLLRSIELVNDDPIRVEFFNVHERAAHALVAAHPLISDDEARAGQQAHVVIVGLGQFGGAVLVTAAQRWAERDTGALAITVVDRHASGRLRGLVMQHPALASAIDPVSIDLDTEAPSADAVADLDTRLLDLPPTLVVVAFEDESRAWSSGLFIRRRVVRPVDVVVRTNSDGGLGQQLQTAVRGDANGRVVPFPVFANACSVSLIEGGVREQLARSIHEDYVARGTGGLYQRAWDELDEPSRESSRAAADSIIARLAAIGLELEPLRRWGAAGEQLTSEQVDQLAADEHTRWKAEREAAGWTWGATRDDGSKKNPLLVDWAELSDEAREHTRRSTAALPQMLARAGFEITRT